MPEIATREELAALVMGAPAHLEGDAQDALGWDEDEYPEDGPARIAETELSCLLDERPYDDEPGKKKYTEHAGHLVRIAVLILHSAAAWKRKAQPKKREPKPEPPPDPQAPLFPGEKQ